VKLLRALGKKYGFEVGVVRPIKILGEIVSSSRIRQLLAEGKTWEARKMLGRPYTIEGEVVHGRHMGHQIGFPTANLRAVRQFLPKDGVYACAVRLGSNYYHAGMNLGKRPTFVDDNHHRQAEVHILRYYGKLYGKDMKVYLLKYLRPEKKFPSPAALVKQIKKDLNQVRRTSLANLKEA
jgi:riboflavin kinase/FMN adenylyltransferase